ANPVGAAGELVGRGRLVFRFPGEFLHLGGGLASDFALAVAADRCGGSGGDGRGDGDGGRMRMRDGLALPGGADAGNAAEGFGAGFEDEIVDADFRSAYFGR